MTDLHQQADDATLVPPDKRADLIPSHITLRSELNALEQDNILSASIWALQRRHDPPRAGATCGSTVSTTRRRRWCNGAASIHAQGWSDAYIYFKHDEAEEAVAASGGMSGPTAVRGFLRTLNSLRLDPRFRGDDVSGG